MGENNIPKIHDRSSNVTSRLGKLVVKLDRVSWGSVPTDIDKKTQIETGQCLSGIEEDLVQSQNHLQELEERINNILGDEDKIDKSNS